jgi:hypothetical protein
METDVPLIVSVAVPLISPSVVLLKLTEPVVKTVADGQVPEIVRTLPPTIAPEGSIQRLR